VRAKLLLRGLEVLPFDPRFPAVSRLLHQPLACLLAKLPLISMARPCLIRAVHLNWFVNPNINQSYPGTFSFGFLEIDLQQLPKFWADYLAQRIQAHWNNQAAANKPTE
jgi:hypothetical protein